MHSIQNRANALFSTFVTALFSVLGVVALSGLVYLYLAELPSSSLEATKVTTKIGRLGYYYDYGSSTEFGSVYFDLDADLSPLFNWNTKLIFVYVTTDYVKTRYTTNTAIIWDDIIHKPRDAIFKLRNQKPEYFVTDISDKLTGVNANLTLHWNVVPWVGLFTWGMQSGSVPLVFPSIQSS